MSECVSSGWKGMVALKKFSRGTRRNAERGEPPKEGTVEVS